MKKLDIIVGVYIIMSLLALTPVTSITDDTCAEFGLGTFERTKCIADIVSLNLSGSTFFEKGNFTSKVFDAGTTADWDNLTWTESLPYWEQFDNSTPQSINMLCDFNGTTDCRMGNMAGKIDDSEGFVTGKFETQAVKINGTGGIEYDNDNFDIADERESVQFWFKPDEVSFWSDGLVHTMFNAVTDADFRVIIRKNVGDQLSFLVEIDDELQNFDFAPPNDNDWHHYALTIDTIADEGHIYLDGLKIGATMVWSKEWTVANPDVIIGGTGSGFNGVNGTYEELVTFDDVRTPTEILNDYKRGILKLNATARSCDDVACSGESFTGNFDRPIINSLSLPTNRYFQYKFFFETLNITYTPELVDVSFNYTTVIVPAPVSNITINLSSIIPLNSSLGNVGLFNTSNLQEIEFMQLNLTIDTLTGGIDSWYINFTADGGSNPCALGNLQSEQCYSFDNDTFKWIQFINGTNTSTFDGGAGNQGDRIIQTVQVNGNNTNISFQFDEHYNPNVFKHYDAIYNWSDVKWQDGVNQRISQNKIIKIGIDELLVPLNADQYKLDMRVNFSGNPTEPLDIFLCNSSYISGPHHDAPECALVIQKMASELQDDGTKARGIFTKELIDELGDLKWVILTNHDSGPLDYFFIKTYKALAVNYTTQWDYSLNDGLTYINLADGYESEMNINWFYDGPDPTRFRFVFWANTTNGESTTFEGNYTWNIDPTQNYPPLVVLISPSFNETINIPHNVTFSTADPNDDNLNVSLLLFKNGILNTTLVADMNQSNSSFLWTQPVPLGLYNLTLQACELGTSDLFCVNDTHPIRITDGDFNLSIFDVGIEWVKLTC